MTRPVTEPDRDAPSHAPEAGPTAPHAHPTPRQRELAGKLTGLSLAQQVRVLAFWPFLEYLLNFFVGLVDTALAGRISVAATDAITIASYIGWLLNLIQMSVGIGATAVIARAIGGRHKRVANAALGQALLLSVFVGIGSGVLVYVLAPWISRFSGLEGEGYAYAVQYLQLIAFAAPASSVMLVGAACLRAAGETRAPFFVLAAVNVVNLLVSYLLVFGPAPLGGHEVHGIAVGTAAAWVTGAVLIVVVLARGGMPVRFRWVRLRPHWHTMRRVISVGAPNLAEGMGIWIGQFMIVGIVGIVRNRFGEIAAIGAHGIAVKVEAVSYLPCMALGIAATTLTGQYLGLGDADRAKRAVRICWAYGAVIMGTMGVLFFTVPEWLVRIVTDEPELLATAPTLIRICGPVQVFFATAIVLQNAVRGAGDTGTSALINYISVYLIRLPAVWVLAIEFELGVNGVWLALCGELVSRGIIFGCYFLSGRWAKVKV